MSGQITHNPGGFPRYTVLADGTIIDTELNCCVTIESKAARERELMERIRTRGPRPWPDDDDVPPRTDGRGANPGRKVPVAYSAFYDRLNAAINADPATPFVVHYRTVLDILGTGPSDSAARSWAMRAGLPVVKMGGGRRSKCGAFLATLLDLVEADPDTAMLAHYKRLARDFAGPVPTVSDTRRWLGRRGARVTPPSAAREKFNGAGKSAETQPLSRGRGPAPKRNEDKQGDQTMPKPHKYQEFHAAMAAAVKADPAAFFLDIYNKVAGAFEGPVPSLNGAKYYARKHGVPTKMMSPKQIAAAAAAARYGKPKAANAAKPPAPREPVANPVREAGEPIESQRINMDLPANPLDIPHATCKCGGLSGQEASNIPAGAAEPVPAAPPEAPQAGKPGGEIAVFLGDGDMDMVADALQEIATDMRRLPRLAARIMEVIQSEDCMEVAG